MKFWKRESGTRTLNWIVFVQSLLWSMTFFFIPLMLADMGLEGLEIGALFSVLTVMTILASFPMGAINDRRGVRTAIAIGLLMLSAYYFLLASAAGFWLLLPVFILGGLASNMVSLSAINMVYKSMGFFDGGRKFGLYQLAVELGSGAGLLIGGVLLFGFDFRLVLLATSAVFLLVFAASLSLPKTGKVKVQLSLYKDMLLKGKFWLLMVPLLLFGMHWGAEQTSYALFLKDFFGLGMLASGLYMGIPILALGIFAYMSGIHMDREAKLGKKSSMLFLGLLISGAGHILMAVPSVYISFIFRIIHEMGDAFVMVSLGVLFASVFPRKAIAGDVGITRVVVVLGSAIGSVLFGYAGFALGFEWPFILSGAITLIAMIPMLVFARSR